MSGIDDDLSRAREISRRLREAESRPGDRPAEGSRFIRFRAAPATDASAAFAPPSAPVLALATPVPPLPYEPSGSLMGRAPWEHFLDWTRRLSGAAAAFVIDEHGFVIAAQGPYSMPEVERIGARLLAALGQIREISADDASAPAVSVPMGELWLTGLTSVGADGSTVTLGVLGPILSSAQVRTALDTALRGRLLAPGM